MIGDGYKDQFPERWPDVYPYIPQGTWTINPGVSLHEFEEYKKNNEKEIASLKKELEELKELLKAAKTFDEKTGQPECEMDDKIDFIKKVAEMIGVNFDDIFSKRTKD